MIHFLRRKRVFVIQLRWPGRRLLWSNSTRGHTCCLGFEVPAELVINITGLSFTYNYITFVWYIITGVILIPELRSRGSLAVKGSWLIYITQQVRYEILLGTEIWVLRFIHSSRKYDELRKEWGVFRMLVLWIRCFNSTFLVGEYVCSLMKSWWKS